MSGDSKDRDPAYGASADPGFARNAVDHGASDSMVDLTVSIVNHSNRALLLECLDSLSANLPRSCSAEIVVLDNASDDGSVAAVRHSFPQVRLIEQRHRAGFAANHNAIIRSTNSRYVMVLNDDAIVGPGVVEFLVSYMDSHPYVGAAAPQVVSRDGTPQQTAWRFPTPGIALTFAVSLGKFGGTQSHARTTGRVDALSGCAMIIRRSALQRVGCFDERFYMYLEDVDLCLRLHQAGFEAHFIPSLRVHHRGQQSSTTTGDRRQNEEWRSRHLYWDKHYSPTAAHAAAILMGIGFAARGVVAMLARPLPLSTNTRIRRWSSAENWGAARKAWRGVREPGLRELAADWNASSTAQRERHYSETLAE